MNSTLRVLVPVTGWPAANWREIWDARELMAFFVWRDVKVRYRQTLLGAAWAILQPLSSALVFTLLFDKLAKVPSSEIAYPVFAYVGMLCWTFFSKGVSGASGSLVGNAPLLTRVYFPRIAVPTATVLAQLADFFVALSLLPILMWGFGEAPSLLAVIAVPAMTVLLVAFTLAVSLWLSALQVYFRDVNYALGFALQLGMFLTPVVYPLSLIPLPYRSLALLNPMTGVVEGFRSALFGGACASDAVAASAGISGALLYTGVRFFRRLERRFADVV